MCEVVKDSALIVVFECNDGANSERAMYYAIMAFDPFQSAE